MHSTHVSSWLMAMMIALMHSTGLSAMPLSVVVKEATLSDGSAHWSGIIDGIGTDPRQIPTPLSVDVHNKSQ